MAERKRLGDEAQSSAIARVECLYPRPLAEIRQELGRYPNLKRIRWVQDEPANMGPWPHYKLNLAPELDVPFERVSRPESASPSVGQSKIHQVEVRQLMADAFA